MKRNHAFDLTRAVLLLIGIPYHVFCMYLVGENWMINSGQPSVAATVMSSLTHSFRMQAFFILAGFFSILLAERRGWNDWMKGRIFRLFFPAVFSTLTVGLAMLFILSLDKNGSAKEAFNNMFEDSYFTVGHIWFLYTLVSICVVFFISRVFFLSLVDIFIKLSVELQRIMPRLVLVIMSAISIVVVGFIPAVFVRLVGDTLGGAAFTVLLYLPFFFIGVVAHRSSKYFNIIFQPGMFLILVGVLSELAYVLFSLYYDFHCGNVMVCHDYIRIAYRSLSMLSGLFVSITVFGLISRLSIGRSRILSYFVSGSLVMYIFHMPYVLIFGYIFKSIRLPAILEIFYISIFTLISTLITYEVIRRFNVLSIMYTGCSAKKSFLN